MPSLFFLSMKNLDLTITVIGMIYGLLLIWIYFVPAKATETLRIDALIMPNPSEATRVLNLVAGLLFAGYSIYSLLAG
ncbi:MAG: hypothetical protein HW415_296 [Deltaproteobacteria bacterium]|nr:hypothetical protein [Deltaproteobacteria bacterium]